MTDDQEKRLENVERLVRVDSALATQLSQSIQRNSRLDNELTKANAEVERLREAIRKVHRVYWSGPDVDMRAVSVACLTLFANTLGADGPSTLPLSPETNRQIEEMRESRREQREKDE